MSKEIRMPYSDYQKLHFIIDQQKAELDKIAALPPQSLIVLDKMSFRQVEREYYFDDRYLSIPIFNGPLEIIKDLDEDYAALRDRVKRAEADYDEAKRRYERLYSSLQREKQEFINRPWYKRLLNIS